jgi:hypothetical protein
MTRQQQTALAYPCLLGIETAHPRFGWLGPARLIGYALTVNRGYE